MTTMQNEAIPAWALAEAAALRSGVIWQSNASNEIIARALVAAERRGLERAAKVADRRASMASQVSHPAAIALLQALPDAIRNLMEGGE